MTFDLDKLKDILKPRFVVKHPDWLPRPAHKYDGAADLKLWCPTAYTRGEALARLDKLHSNLILCYNCQLYLNGKLQFTEHKRISPVEWNNNKEEFVEQFLCEDGSYRFELLSPSENKKMHVGFKIALPELPEPFTATYLIIPRSGLAVKHRISIINSPGLIDAEYRDDVQACVINNGPDYHLFTHGARIAQGCYTIAVAQSSYNKEDMIVDELEETDRKGGFGHTGV